MQRAMAMEFEMVFGDDAAEDGLMLEDELFQSLLAAPSAPDLYSFPSLKDELPGHPASCQPASSHQGCTLLAPVRISRGPPTKLRCIRAAPAPGKSIEAALKSWRADCSLCMSQRLQHLTVCLRRLLSRFQLQQLPSIALARTRPAAALRAPA